MAGFRRLLGGLQEVNRSFGAVQQSAREAASTIETSMKRASTTASEQGRQITDGLSQAADGAPKLVDGAQRLSDEGTSKLVEAGEDTAQNYGELYATIVAGAERADASKMAYGAPEGAQALMAYSFVIEGENGEGGRNVARGLAGLALLGMGAGAFAFRRGMV